MEIRYKLVSLTNRLTENGSEYFIRKNYSNKFNKKFKVLVPE